MHIGEGIMKNDGVTLIELLVVVSILSISVVAAGFSYQDWMGRYRIEKATKDLYTDLMNARVLAMQTNRQHFAVLDGFSYSIVEDTNDNEVYDAGDKPLPQFPKSVDYLLDKNGSGNRIDFDKRGLIAQSRTLRFTSSCPDPDFDCMKVSRTRIIMGQYKNSECIAR
jgi:prepilin-type N-terminal cleavage/methylation domain-containing protein